MANYQLDYQLAQMARGAYGKPADRIEGWTAVDAEPKNGQDNAHGFAAVAYRNNTTGDVVIAYRGTNSLANDASADAAVGLPFVAAWDNQFKDALDFAKRVKDAHPHAAISVTGHSLGGGLAQVASQAYGFHGITFDPAGAENIVRSSQFKEWTSSHGLGNGRGVPSNFHNYLVAKSPVSHDSGAHLGKTTEISSIHGRSAGEVVATKTARVAGVGVVGGAGYGVDAINSHRMERIEGVFKEAFETGKMPKVYPVIGQGESETKLAANEIPMQRTAEQAKVEERKTLITDKVLVAMNDLCDRYNYTNPVARENTCWGGANKAVHSDFTGQGTIIAGVDGTQIALREDNGNFVYKSVQFDSREVANIPAEQSKSEIAAYQPAVATVDNDLSQVKTRSGPSMG